MRRTNAAPTRSQRAGTKSGNDVVALGREEVAVARTRDPCTGGETSSAQHLARIEPRLRIILVWIRGEAGERHEIRARPFPHIASHLPASERAVASGACHRPSASRPRSLRRQPPLPIRPRSEAGAWPSYTRLAPRTS